MSGRRVRKRPLHRSIDYGRVELDRQTRGQTLEVVFAEQWEKENARRPGINFGHGILQDLMFKRRGLSTVCRFIIRRRDAAIAATVVQWLGTNVGFCFVESCLKLAGYRVLYPSAVDYEQRLQEREQALREEQRSWLKMVYDVRNLGKATSEVERLRALEAAARSTRECMEAHL